MGRATREKAERVKQRLLQYYTSGGKPSYRAAAKELGVDRLTVKKYAEELRLDFSKKDPFAPELPARHSDHRPPTGIPPETAVEAEQSDVEGPTNDVSSGEACDEESELDPQTSVDRLASMVDRLPELVIQTVKDTLGQTFPNGLTNASQGADRTAVQKISELTNREVAAVATDIVTTNQETGEYVRRIWNDGGFRADFPTPKSLFDVAFRFWWENRDRLLNAEDQIRELEQRLDDALRRVDNETIMYQARDHAWLVILGLRAKGVVLSEEEIAEYLRVAQEAVIRWPGDLPATRPARRDHPLEGGAPS